MRFLAAAGLVTILAGLGAYYTTQAMTLFSIVNLVAAPLLLTVAGVSAVRRFQGFSGALPRRIALRWGAIGTAVLAACVLATLLSLSWDAAIDLTVERRYTLSDQTLGVCAELAEGAAGADPTLLFFQDTHLAGDVRPLVQAYRSACPALSVRRLHNADAPPEAAPLIEMMDATVLVCAEARCEPVGFPSEAQITAGLLRLLHKGALRVHFLVGHGEANLKGTGRSGYLALTTTLIDEGIDVAVVVGPATTEIPSDVRVLIAAAPERDLLAAELEALDAFLERGGRLLVLLEPGARTNLTTLLERWGFGLPGGIVMDRTTSPLVEEPDPVSLLVRAYNAFHPVTRKLSNRSMTLLPGVRPVQPDHNPRPEDDLAALAFSSRRSWLEPDVHAALGGRRTWAKRAGRAVGALSIAAAGRYPRRAGEARIVVVGDADFASNRLLAALYNRDLFMNAVLWLAEREEQLAIRPKFWTPDQSPLTLQQTLAYFYFLAFALPEVLLLLGIRAWYRQQRR